MVEMLITHEQLDQYHNRGYLVLEGFADESECDLLRARAEELVQEFDPAGIVSVFSTNEQDRLTDEYFLASGDKTRFFFEANAFNSDGTLKYEKEKSINKIGHALHDLDPVFDRFSRNERVKELARALGLENPYLWAIPGGHRRGLKSRWHRSRDGGMEFEVFDNEPWSEEELIPLEVSKGTLILLHGLLPHRSFENRSPRSRHAYTLHLIGAKANYPDNNWLQRNEMPLRGFE